MADARSPTMRENVWNWYNGSLYNRMEPDGAIVIIGHRMHEDDLQGRLEERMRAHDEYADQWTIVELPAVAGQHDQPRPRAWRSVVARAFQPAAARAYQVQQPGPELVGALSAAADA